MTEVVKREPLWRAVKCWSCGDRIDDLGVALGKDLCFACDPADDRTKEEREAA